jgi:hypothetical protein
LDQDDRWLPDKLQKQMEFAQLHPEVNAVYTDATEFNEQGIVHESFVALFPGLSTTDHMFAKIVSRNVPLMSTFLLRSAFLREHDLRFCEVACGVDELPLLLRIAAKGGGFGYLPEKLTFRRLHTTNLSQNHLNRFQMRIVAYGRLLQDLNGASAAFRGIVRAGLRDAHFRVGEWFWGNGDLNEARYHFRRSVYPNKLGMKGLMFFGLTWLSPALIRNLRGMVRKMRAPLSARSVVKEPR